MRSRATGVHRGNPNLDAFVNNHESHVTKRWTLGAGARLRVRRWAVVMAALRDLVDKYKISKELEKMWRSTMTQPEKMVIDRVLGCGEDARLAFGIEVTAHVLGGLAEGVARRGGGSPRREGVAR